MTKKEKRVEKSKEQLLAELRMNEAFKKRMKFIKTQFFPALILASKNVDDAQMLLTGFNNIIMQTFLGLMKEKTVKDLNLEGKLATENDHFQESKDLLSLFADMSVFEAKEMVEGMKNEIALFQNEYWKSTSLADLPVKWLDEANP